MLQKNQEKVGKLKLIRINKGTEIPERLTVQGSQETQKICDAYDKDPTIYNDKFKFKDKIYNHASVKEILKSAQHNKCCFCEKSQVDECGAVEHFRPKRGFRRSRTDKKDIKPGYYWLVFNWENLYFICSTCNSSFKKTFFPIVDESKRARNHHNDVGEETPLLVDPGKEDPREFIEFHDELIKDLDDRGDQTIKICGLDRPDLDELRLVELGHIRTRQDVLECSSDYSSDTVRKAEDYLEDAVKPSAKFSSMAINFLSKENSD